MLNPVCVCVVLFFNDTATTENYTYGLTPALHGALPICYRLAVRGSGALWMKASEAAASENEGMPNSGGSQSLAIVQLQGDPFRHRPSGRMKGLISRIEPAGRWMCRTREPEWLGHNIGRALGRERGCRLG